MRLENIPDHFRTRIKLVGECWLWTAASIAAHGGGRYGRVWLKGPLYGRLAHQALWLALELPLATGEQLHHECENKLCVRPAHLRPATQAEHARLHISGTCGNGHVYAEVGYYLRSPRPAQNGPNGQPSRVCLGCKRESRARSRLRKAA